MNQGNTDGDKLSVAPKYTVENTSYGMRACAARPWMDDSSFIRISEYLLPFIAMTPGALNKTGRESSFFMAVPIDNTAHLLFWGLFNTEAPVGDQQRFYTKDPSPDFDNFATFSGNRENCWGQDRAEMPKGHLSGFTTHLLQEDVVVQISMGVIANRTKETLCRTDLAVARCRSLLLELLKREEAGEAVSEVLSNVSPATLPIGGVFPATFDWRKSAA
jgi:phthalate 4,5-dioxygenase oxygenase subunit